MRLTRASGILLHPTSLPSRFGVGDLGPGADSFLDMLSESGQTWWQMLPFGPTGYGNSPYQSTSSYAGNPMLISPEKLAEEGLLTPQDWADYPNFSEEAADFEAVEVAKTKLFRLAFTRFDTHRDDFREFRNWHGYWLADYALYRAIKDERGGAPWYSWDGPLVRREYDALQQTRDRLYQEVLFHEFVQFMFDRQWNRLRGRCRERGIKLIGDVPIFVAHDSADVWARPDLFFLNDHGKPTVVAGVPPDYFSETGQLWGNPLYNWEAHQREGFRWWISRMQAVINRVDLVRLDHFRGFEAYWEVPGDAPTAASGRWVMGPRDAFLAALRDGLHGLPLIAEDLGLITDEVRALRDRFQLPGMRILQFAFGRDPKESGDLPHNYIPHSVAYTGTHDNDTAVGWFQMKAGDGSTTMSQDQIDRERNFVKAYVDSDGPNIHWRMIRVVAFSNSDTTIFPLQDLLGLGSDCRMNVPGKGDGNWRWRVRPGAITTEVKAEFARITAASGRWNGTPPAPYRYG